MQINIAQKIQVFVILAIVNCLNALDLLFGEFFEQAFSFAGKVTATVISVIFVGFLVYNYQSGFLKNVALGYYSSTFPISNSSSQVLGLSAKRKEFPYLVVNNKVPPVTAKAVLIVDKKSKKVLYEQNSSARLASASTTKLMTALVALDIYKLDEIVDVPQVCFDVDSTKAGLPKGSIYKVKDLLNTMLIASAGDAACALSLGKVGQDEFIFRMNQKANQIGMHSSFFTNPVGLDGENSSHFSSAQDLYKLTNAAMSNEVIRQIVKTKEYTVKSVDDSFIGKIETTNKLLYEIPQTVGVKTGKTTEAGEVLIYEYQDDIKDFVIIVMGSEERFSDVRALLNWLLVSYAWR